MLQNKKIPVAVLVSLMCGGCDVDPMVTAQRDVYRSRQDCLSDWKDPSLCRGREEEKGKDQNQSNTSIGRTTGSSYFYGPHYVSGYRKAFVGDREFVRSPNPSQLTETVSVRRSSLPPQVSSLATPSTPSRFSLSRTTRGGFGRTGSTMSFGG